MTAYLPPEAKPMTPQEAASLVLAMTWGMVRDDSDLLTRVGERAKLPQLTDYVSACVAAMNAVRQPDGTLPPHVEATLDAARQALHSVAMATDDAALRRMQGAHDAKAGRTDPDLVTDPDYQAGQASVAVSNTLHGDAQAMHLERLAALHLERE